MSASECKGIGYWLCTVLYLITVLFSFLLSGVTKLVLHLFKKVKKSCLSQIEEKEGMYRYNCTVLLVMRRTVRGFDDVTSVYASAPA
jgi:hypothetical protein